MHPFFSDNEHLAFTQLLVFIAKADGEITEREIDFLDDYACKTGIDWNGFEELSLEEILSNFTTYPSKIGVIQEVVKLAMIDGNYSEEEKAGIDEIAKMLSLSESKVVSIENWVRRGLEWIAEGQAMKNDINE